jgi:GH15 family glucan-1,4-alpha-glucosidase
MACKPISSYGIVGDLRTAALIGQDGAVDWLCLPRFDSPSVFGAILDQKRGGHFTIAPRSDQVRTQQIYKPDTNILVTRFLTAGAVIELTDFMPVRSNPLEQQGPRLMRRVKAVSGCERITVQCAPAFQYAGQSHEIDVRDQEVFFRTPSLGLRLVTPIELKKAGSGVVGEFTLQESESIGFALGDISDGFLKELTLFDPALDELEGSTASYWREWVRKSTYHGRWREVVHRSALMLELLTYAPSGAVIAAPSCSLPEWIGGERNWDYRYNWIRDAAYTIYALLRIGLFDEATRFMGWIEERCAEMAGDGPLQTVYAVDGGRDLHEQTLENLEGYCGSRPVRIGNGAFKQLQLDIYGALIDAVYLYNKHVQPITGVLWRDVRRLVNWVCDHWQEEDQGIWELRGNSRQLVHSKVMCWVALDRGSRLAIKRSLPADLARWLACRDQIYKEVLSRGWSDERKSFVQSYGSRTLDASVLMMPLVFFMTPDDPMMISTVEAINRPVSKGGLVTDGMVYRYESSTDDGLTGAEGTFNVCTFWLVEALTRMGRTEQAQWLFEKMLSRASHLGLYSEEMSADGLQLGNFPQALTHMGLISAAYNLDKALDTRAKAA